MLLNCFLIVICDSLRSTDSILDFGRTLNSELLLAEFPLSPFNCNLVVTTDKSFTLISVVGKLPYTTPCTLSIGEISNSLARYET